MKYFNVTAKCGHVGGPNKYILIDFYIKAENGKDAAAKVRMLGRVKHDHKDAIRDVREIDYPTYLIGIASFSDDPYNFCHNSQEQKQYMDSIFPRILVEECEDSHYKSRVPNRKRALRFGYTSCRRSKSYYYEHDEYCA